MGLLWGLLIVLLLNGLVFPRFSGAQLADTDYGTFIGKVDNGLVKEVIIKNGQIYFTAEGSDRKTRTYRTGEIGDPGMVERLLKAPSPNPNGKIAFNRIIPHENSPILNFVLMWVLPGLCFYLIWRLWRQAGRSIQARLKDGGNFLSLGSSGAKIYADTDVKTTFADVAGQDEAKDALQEIVDFLHDPSKYAEIGATLPKDALLVGPPGTGKTLIARAVAGQAKVPFFAISGSEFVQMFVGMGAAKVRDLFKQAGEKAPCIIFIDEIDAIGKRRDSAFGGNDEREQTLNQLLTEMDGFQTNTGVIVLAATNRVDILDKALTRAGRFDRQIEVGLPDVNERKEIFDVHLRPLKLDPQLDRSFLARQTPGFSGADIANVCNEAALIAARHNKKFVTREDFLAAIDRIVGGLEKPNMPMTPEERRITAIHEAGHAVVMWSLPECDPVLKVTVVPRGRSLGATWSSPDEDRIHVTDEALEEQLAGLLGGRIAEEVNYHTLGVGALSDLERATKTAYAMVTYYGMSKKIGPLSYYDSTGTRDTFTKPFSEQTAHDIDVEVRRFVEEAYARARAIIEAKNAQINAIADLLLEKETIYSEDLEQILGPAAQQPRNTAAKGGDAAKGDAADARPADGTAAASDTEQADASDAKNGAPAASGATEPDEPKRENTPEPTSEH